MKRASLIAVSFLLTLACDGDKAPTTPQPPFVPAATTVSFAVSPPIQTIPPGQTARLTATAHYSDGSTRDVTSQASWTSSQVRVATVSAGAVTGVALGRTMIRANFERFSTAMTIVIQPDGTFILKGKVTEPGGVVVGSAAVEVISGPPNQAITNSIGDYELFGMAGTFILRVGKTGYFDERRTVTMSGDQSLAVEITPRSAPAGVAGTYRVTFTASPSCTTLPAELKTRTYTARIESGCRPAGHHAERCSVRYCSVPGVAEHVLRKGLWRIGDIRYRQLFFLLFLFLWSGCRRAVANWSNPHHLGHNDRSSHAPIHLRHTCGRVQCDDRNAQTHVMLRL